MKRLKPAAVCILLAFLASGLAAGCQPVPSPAAAAARPVAGEVTIHVASNGWHTTVVLARHDLLPGAIPEAADFPRARWLSFGWGDAEYFPAREPTVSMTLRAGLLPTRAVVLMGGLEVPGHELYPTAEIVALSVTKDGLRALVAYIGATFDRQGAARARTVAPGLDPFSRFYPATGTFHALNTCNTWTAGALEAAGLPVRSFGTVTAEDLMAQVRELTKP